MQGNFDPMTFNMMLNMMNVMHPNMGYNSNNYNYNMNNSADSMNLMMNWMNMNPLLLQMYNNMFQNNNNINLNNSNNSQTNFNGGINTDAPSTCYDLSQNSNEIKINVAFIHQSGKKTMMICPYSLKVKDLLSQYISRMGLSDHIIGKEIFFIYNGLKIDEKEEKIIGQFFFKGMLQTILVVDTKNIIGAKSLLFN
jgi:hypothetical protein